MFQVLKVGLQQAARCLHVRACCLLKVASARRLSRARVHKMPLPEYIEQVNRRNMCLLLHRGGGPCCQPHVHHTGELHQ